ncbi:hypothetical protein Q4511_10890 [Paracoccus sp. 1_MG-2023]|nr:hypothetical protein [Paracoccus sp. 1_MG-2023]MDO6669429.1 hypothetical protein [Paracoccus sp. 1_MG-2023]
MSNSKYGGRGFHHVSEFPPALDAFTRSYEVAQAVPGAPKFNSCHSCLANMGCPTPPETHFELGQCSSCGDVALICDPWLSDLYQAFDLRPGPVLPVVRQPFSHSSLMPHVQLLALIGRHLKRPSGSKGEQ